MNEADARQCRRRTFKRRYVILLIIVVAASLVSLYFATRQGTVERRLAALRAAGYPTSLAEWGESHKLGEGVRNAADVYKEAFSLLTSPPEEANVPILGRDGLPETGAVWPEDMVQDVAACLAGNRPCLDRLHAAAEIEDCWYDWEYFTGLPILQGVRDCGRLLDLEMLYHAQKGDASAVVASFRAGLRLADSVRNEPMLLPHLGARMPCTGLLLSGLAWALSATTFTDEQLQEMDGVLGQTALQWDFTHVLAGERCWLIEMCRDPQLYGTNVGQGAILDSSLVKKDGLLDLLDYMADCIEASKLPPTQRLARFRAIDDRAQRLPFWHFVIRRSQPSCGGTAILDLRLPAHLDLARTAIAVERYRLAMGGVPEQLDQLVPRYLKEVPLDPFDGKPLRYKRTEPGYLVYCILEDGQDNGGRQKDGLEDTAPYDWCFTVTR